MKSRVHPKYTTTYRVGNWAEYDRALVRRGDVTLWLTPDAIATWAAAGVGRRSGQLQYSDLAIETALTLSLIFHVPLRQTEGVLTSIFGMLGVDLTAPDHTTLSRRGPHLALALRRARPGTSLHLIVDSTGLSIVGDGEWAAATHGGRGRRGWRKLHLGVDGSRVIVACALTEPTADDAMTGISLVDEVDGHLTRVTADPADDTHRVTMVRPVREGRGSWCRRPRPRRCLDGAPDQVPAMDDQEGEGARTATVEVRRLGPISTRAWRMRSSGTRRSSATVFGHAVHRGNGVRPCSRVTF